jgi:hypothetical protein
MTAKDLHEVKPSGKLRELMKAREPTLPGSILVG